MKCMLIILDGWGIAAPGETNAVSLANTPFLDNLMQAYPSTRLNCSGEAVGLPDGVMGNSEVGHLNIGAGRIVYQDLLRINLAIQNGDLKKNTAVCNLMTAIGENDGALHLMGLVSDGGVHSHIDHLKALIDMANANGLEKLYVHAILDGRDTAPDSGQGFVQALQRHLQSCKSGQIASVCGRYYAMDRDTRWDRIEKAYRLYTRAAGIGETDPVEAVRNAYARKETDEFVQPIALMRKNGNPVAVIEKIDGVLFFNFRADRAREITRALTQPDFDHFERSPDARPERYVCMTEYDSDFGLPVAFPPLRLTNILGEVISKQGFKQLRIAETEKYAHVTYFLNGGEEKPFPGEDRRLVASPRDVPTYDYKPEMSAVAVTDEVIPRIRSGEYDFIVLNFANMDMVGHTGIIEAAVKACETVDRCLKRIVPEVEKAGGTVLITADHGNAEQMRDSRGQPHTAHTCNQVPLILVKADRKNDRLRSDGILGDIAPTILRLAGIAQPSEMTGRSLLTE